jgi:hypothetical protein
MTKEELKKAVSLEIQWIKYYGLKEDREKYDTSKLPYEQLRSIGYTKKVIPLSNRCGFCRITSDKLISKSIDIDDIKISTDIRDISNNIYTALDFWTIKYQDDMEWIKQDIT